MTHTQEDMGSSHSKKLVLKCNWCDFEFTVPIPTTDANSQFNCPSCGAEFKLKPQGEKYNIDRRFIC